MARNNWANDAFKKAQNLMSRGYNDFEPTTVVTKDQLSDLGDAITTPRPSMVGTNQLDNHMLSPWNIDHKSKEAGGYEAETHAYDPDNTPVDGIDFEAQAKKLNTERYDVWDGSESEVGKWARDNGFLKERPDEDYHDEKELRMAVQLVEKEIQKNTYSMFTSQTKEEKAYKDKRLEDLNREKRRLVEKYQAKSWELGGTKDQFSKGKDRVKREEEALTGAGEDIEAQRNVLSGEGTVQAERMSHNNPGNIKKTDIKWDGEGSATYGKGFTTFKTPEDGIRALTKDLTSKLEEFDGDLKAMISKYAPEKDGNDVKKYLQVVQKSAGKKYRYTEADLQNIVKGFIRMENKKELADYYIKLMGR
jgi:hypothetical protein